MNDERLGSVKTAHSHPARLNGLVFLLGKIFKCCTLKIYPLYRNFWIAIANEFEQRDWNPGQALVETISSKTSLQEK